MENGIKNVKFPIVLIIQDTVNQIFVYLMVVYHYVLSVKDFILTK